MAIRSTLAVVLAALLLASCIPEGSSDPRTDASPKPTPAERKTTEPAGRDGPIVRLESVGYARPLFRRAIADLKRIGFWDDLTKHLYVINIDSRLGTLNVPHDGHLADAYFTGTIEEDGAGALCDVMFFPTAVSNDLARWRLYYSQGRIAEPPPTLRNFYASLVAHELAHCLLGPRGEPVARSWERRTRDALLEAG